MCVVVCRRKFIAQCSKHEELEYCYTHSYYHMNQYLVVDAALERTRVRARTYMHIHGNMKERAAATAAVHQASFAAAAAAAGVGDFFFM